MKVLGSYRPVVVACQALIVSSLWSAPIYSQQDPIRIAIDTQKELGPMEIDRFGLGQGGLSDVPMWQDRVPEIRSLNPRLIRLFIQEYFDVYPRRGTYHWKTLDESVSTILKTGAQPLMCIAIKPKVLYPVINQDIVEPTQYAEWEELIYQMVKHYEGKNIHYWEVTNEPDIGESGGCPSRLTAENYPRFYESTVKAILRANPKAKVGGPALANVRSPIFRALLEHCSSRSIPLHFVSWHIYHSDPLKIRDTISYAKGLLAQFPSLRCETILNEWNMSLRNPVQVHASSLASLPRWHTRCSKPSWIIPVTTISAITTSAKSSSASSCLRRGTCSWPAGGTICLSLMDYLIFRMFWAVFFTFKLLSRLVGNRLAAESKADEARPHLFSAIEPARDRINTLIWNFGLTAPAEIHVELEFRGMQNAWKAWQTALDAVTPSNDENHRLVKGDLENVSPQNPRLSIKLGAYDVRLVTLEKQAVRP